MGVLTQTRVLGSGTLGLPAELPASTMLGDWRVEEKIGEGGMGTVYSAVHERIGKRAAIKVIRAEMCTSPGANQRLLDEARLVNQIEHRNIVDIFYAGELPDGRPYLVMELLAGKTLGERLSEGRIDPVDAIEILLQICAALGAAHARGVIHRDLKPDNVVLVGGSVVKLLDWGVAKLTDPGDVGATGLGTLVGTPRYIAPEQARGRKVGPATDVYSLGAIAYELFLGKPPFEADNIADLLAAHLHEPVMPARELWPWVPDELDRLLLAMLAKDPAERPSLDDITAALPQIREELEERSRTEVAAAAPPPRGRAALTVACIAVVTLLMLGGFRSLAGSNRRLAPSALAGRYDVVLAAPRPLSPTSRLEVLFTPAVARVLVDGIPIDGEPGRAVRGLPPGLHLVTVVADGFVPYGRTLEVGPGSLLLAVDLRKVEPARRDVTPRAVTSRRRIRTRIDPDAVIDSFP